MFAVLSDVIEFDSFLQKSNDQILLVKISADWCMPCKKMQKEIDKLLAEVNTSQVNINHQQKLIALEIDVEKVPDLVQSTGINDFKVKSIPALFVFHHGKLKKSNQDYWKIRENYPHLSLQEQLKEFIKI